MAIQIRRGTDAQYEAMKPQLIVGEPNMTTDTKRMMVCVGGNAFAELTNIDRVGSAYDPGITYLRGDYAIHQGKLYKCLEETTGTFDASKWEQTSFVGLIKEIRETL